MFGKKKKRTEEKQDPPQQKNNPYLAGRLAWAEMYGSFIQERNTWRTISFFLAIILILLGSANIYQLRMNKVVPYIVEVDRAGRVSGVQSAKQLETRVEIIQYNLAAFITSWRTVTADIALQEKYVNQTSFMSVNAAKKMLSEWYGKNNPYITSEKKLVEVRITVLPLFISGKTWAVEWEEIERTHDGAERGREKFQANLTIAQKAPVTSDEILKNAPGIYITEINHSKKIFK